MTFIDFQGYIFLGIIGIFMGKQYIYIYIFFFREKKESREIAELFEGEEKHDTE